MISLQKAHSNQIQLDCVYNLFIPSAQTDVITMRNFKLKQAVITISDDHRTRTES